jgi:hypothetical protein
VSAASWLHYATHTACGDLLIVMRALEVTSAATRTMVHHTEARAPKIAVAASVFLSLVWMYDVMRHHHVHLCHGDARARSHVGSEERDAVGA